MLSGFDAKPYRKRSCGVLCEQSINTFPWDETAMAGHGHVAFRTAAWSPDASAKPARVYVNAPT